MSFKNSYGGKMGLGGSPKSSFHNEGEKLMRSRHAGGGQPRRTQAEEAQLDYDERHRANHYLGEGVVKKVKGAINNSPPAKAYKKVKGAIKTGKEIYKSGKELYGQAKEGIAAGKKLYSENKEHIQKGISDSKKLYNETAKPLADKAMSTASDAVGSIKKAVGRKSGGSMNRECHSWGAIAGMGKAMKRSEGGSAKREKHNAGAIAGTAMKYLPAAAKLVAPSLIGWGMNKMLNKGKKTAKFNGGEVRENRTARKVEVPGSKGKRSEHAAGGAGKTRKDQYDY